jgi:uncharacterized protein YdeI (YjbR/CyaY-like superfamily)
MPIDLEKALAKNKKAEENFYNFAPSYRRNYIHWVTAARRQETKDRRIKEVVKRAGQNMKPGMI